MRLGKSLTALRWAAGRQCRRTLVVCPLTVAGSWIGEVEAEGGRAILLRGSEEACLKELALTIAFGQPFTAIINYQLLVRRPRLASILWDAVVLDETTEIRNPQAKTTKFILKAFRHVENRAILSGSPAPEHDLEYWSQFYFLFGHFLGYRDYWEFRRGAFHPGFGGWNWEPNRGTREKIKQFLDQHSHQLTRHQAGISTQKIRSVRTVTLPAKILKVYRDSIRHFTVAGGVEAKHAPVIQGFLRQLTGGFVPGHEGGWKTDELLALLKGDLRGQQVVVWFAFIREIIGVFELLEAKGWKGRVGVIRGATPRKLRQVRIEAFRAGDLDIVLCQNDCARFGLDFSTADTSICYSNPWSNLTRMQLEDRIIHPTKTTPCLILDLCCAETIEEKVREVLLEKRVSSRLFLDRVMEKFQHGTGSNAGRGQPHHPVRGNNDGSQAVPAARK